MVIIAALKLNPCYTLHNAWTDSRTALIIYYICTQSQLNAAKDYYFILASYLDYFELIGLKPKEIMTKRANLGTLAIPLGPIHGCNRSIPPSRDTTPGSSAMRSSPP